MEERNISTFTLDEVNKIYSEAYLKGFNDAVEFITNKIKSMTKKGESNG